jgi:predicted RNA-binding Zn-ribbon protein involved in translation (DUF1610 family)
MPINMTCPSCSKVLAAPDSAVGKRAKCPGCGQIMIVPEAVFDAEMFGDHHLQQPSGATGQAASADPWLAGTSAEDEAATSADGQSRRPCPECGEMIVVSAAKCRFCGAIFDTRLRGRSYRALGIDLGPPGDYARQIRAWYNVWWISFALGASIMVGAFTFAALDENPDLAYLAIVGGIFILVGFITYYVLLFKLWNVVQDGRAQTTPGCAVGFLFIPCFNIYWQFVAIWGLAKELNRISREYNIGAREANETLALTECIVFCSMVIAGLLALIAWFIIKIFVMKNLCDVAVAIAGPLKTATD